MRWLFYALAALAAVLGVAAIAGAPSVFQEIAGMIALLFAVVCLGIGAILGRRR